MTGTTATYRYSQLIKYIVKERTVDAREFIMLLSSTRD